MKKIFVLGLLVCVSAFVAYAPPPIGGPISGGQGGGSGSITNLAEVTNIVSGVVTGVVNGAVSVATNNPSIVRTNAASVNSLLINQSNIWSVGVSQGHGVLVGVGNNDWQEVLRAGLFETCINGGFVGGLFNNITSVTATASSASLLGGDLTLAKNCSLLSLDGSILTADMAHMENATITADKGGQIVGSLLQSSNHTIAVDGGSSLRIAGPYSGGLTIDSHSGSQVHLNAATRTNITIYADNGATVSGSPPSDFTGNFANSISLLCPTGLVFNVTSNGAVSGRSFTTTAGGQFTGNGAGLTNLPQSVTGGYWQTNAAAASSISNNYRVAIGNQVKLSVGTNTAALVVNGTNAIIHHDQLRSWFIAGAGTLNPDTNGASSALQNTAVGYASETALTTGYNNSALGALCLAYVTSGYWNSAVGVRAMRDCAGGYQNTALGVEALYRVTSGFNNTAIGVQSLSTLTTSDNNTAIGYQASRDSVGWYNSAFGASALVQNSGGSFNVGFGFQSLSGATSGDGNTGVGAYAGDGLTAGSYNTIIGFKAGRSSQSSSSNIVIGAGCDLLSNTGNTLNIGCAIFGTGLNGAGTTPVAGQKIGINTKTPSTELEVNGIVTASSYLTPTNHATTTPDFTKSAQIYETNNVVVLAAPTGIDATKYQEMLYVIKTSDGGVDAIDASALSGYVLAGTWYVTNLTEVKIQAYGNVYKKATAIPVN